MYYTSREVYEYISKQTNDPIVEWKICRVSSSQFPIYKSDLEFYDKVSPIFDGVKYKIPTPTLCPEERERRRLVFRNERKLYRRKCDFSGKDIISIYSPEFQGKVYDQKVRWSDAWDPMQYGRDFDFSMTFKDQFGELMRDVPRPTSINDDGIGSVNCQYTVDFALGKNCYMCFTTGENEDCLYCHHCNTSNDLLDCDLVIGKSSNSYQCQNCENIFNCYYCENCKSCSNCFGCIGLRNKSYYFFNQQLSKDSYEKKIISLNEKEINILFFKLKQDTILQNLNIINSEYSFGDNIYNSKSILGFNMFNSQNSMYCTDSDRVSDCYDLQCRKSQLCYEGLTPDNGYLVCFSWFSWKCKNSFYVDSCHSCQNCFGCVGLRNKSYCIFNKQYIKSEYEELVPKIIEYMQETGERGEFFDPSLSPFGYNESVAQEYFPLTREESLARGYKRQDKEYPVNIPDGMTTIQARNLPDSINDVTDDIVNKAIICEVSGKPFRLVKPELEFYRKHNLSIPHKHPDVRHTERLEKRPPRELHIRNCDMCGVEMLSVYSQNHGFLQINTDYTDTSKLKQKIYCEACYNHEIYG